MLRVRVVSFIPKVCCDQVSTLAHSDLTPFVICLSSLRASSVQPTHRSRSPLPWCSATPKAPHSVFILEIFRTWLIVFCVCVQNAYVCWFSVYLMICLMGRGIHAVASKVLRSRTYFSCCLTNKCCFRSFFLRSSLQKRNTAGYANQTSYCRSTQSDMSMTDQRHRSRHRGRISTGWRGRP